jgi:hypothetical protein
MLPWAAKQPARRIRCLFPASQFAKCSLAAPAEARSLFLPDIELTEYWRNACAAALFRSFGRRIAVIFEKDPDIGQITGRRVRI